MLFDKYETLFGSPRNEGNTMTTIRFPANPAKILEGIVWICDRKPGKGFHYILKTLFYADKWHLSCYGRPVFGDTYIKMPFGPVASLAYNILHGRAPSRRSRAATARASWS